MKIAFSLGQAGRTRLDQADRQQLARDHALLASVASTISHSKSVLQLQSEHRHTAYAEAMLHIKISLDYDEDLSQDSKMVEVDGSSSAKKPHPASATLAPRFHNS